ncbi:uncharacterized protein LOC135840026 [Planococcus citri]|uniref:uncharacterized protein LOC135840026 n=1 Tax=Planococcus citri TaxID=170843 RepID=UPI0031F8CABE
MPVCVKCKTKKSRLDYFSFPTDAEVKEKWLDFLKSDGLRWRKESKLCSRHFTPDCIITEADQRILKGGSVPTLQVQKETKPIPAKRYSKTKKCILCGNNSLDLTYFPIPKEAAMKEKWEKFCEFEFGEGNYNLCHLHFKPKYVTMGNNGKRKLASNAIPSIYFDDYQFEFIPVDRNKTNNEDSSSDVECVTIEPSDHSYTARNQDEDSIISIDYEECNTSPRTSAINDKTTSNSISNDIVNIFIPSYEDQVADNNNSTNNESASSSNQTAKKKSVAVYSPSGRKKRMYYPGDLRDDDINSLEVAKISIQNFRKVIDKKSKTIKVLSVKVRRLQNKNASLKETIRQLRAEKAAKEAKEKEDLFEVKGWWDS